MNNAFSAALAGVSVYRNLLELPPVAALRSLFRTLERGEGRRPWKPILPPSTPWPRRAMTASAPTSPISSATAVPPTPRLWPGARPPTA